MTSWVPRAKGLWWVQGKALVGGGGGGPTPGRRQGPPARDEAGRTQVPVHKFLFDVSFDVDEQAAATDALVRLADGVGQLVADRDDVNAGRTAQPLRIALAVIGKLLPRKRIELDADAGIRVRRLPGQAAHADILDEFLAGWRRKISMEPKLRAVPE